MKARLIASGVAALAVASVAVPAVLSGSAAAKVPAAAPTLTACKPVPAVIGKTMTVTGTGLTHATVTIGTTAVPKPHDFAKKITFKVPTGIKTTSGHASVKVKTAGGSASLKCTFHKASTK